MRCIKEDELVLFYYRDLKKSRLKLIENHLKTCQHCLKRYKGLESLFARLKSDPLQLKKEELENILTNVRGQIRKHHILDDTRERINTFLQNLRLGLSYKPKLVPVVVILIVALGIWPLIGKIQRPLDREFDILQIEVELSLDNLEWSIFELYEEDFAFIDEMSHLRYPTPRSKT